MTALSYVLEKASICEAFLISVCEQSCQAVVDLTVTRSDEFRVVYRLLITEKEQKLSVKELVPNKLPDFCPQLHINSDGTFCLGWDGEINGKITDQASAQAWWQRLHNFLRLQERAKIKKTWPSKEWAHGQAAPYQQKAEHIANLLGKDFTEDLDNGKFHTRLLTRSYKNKVFLGLYRKELLVYMVSLQNQKVLNKQQVCICRDGNIRRHRRLKSCSNHAELASAFAIAIHEWQTKEQEFWEIFKDHKCCGLMTGCKVGA